MKEVIMCLLAFFPIAFIHGQGSVKSLYDFQVKDIDGNIFDMSSLKGKKVMIVNTASRCGYTPQYKDLEDLYQKYKNRNFVIIGFPANNFLNQEPGTNAEIKQFCSLNYNVSFPMMEKISVKGKDMHPLYQWLTQKAQNGVFDAPVKWNFQKFLIDGNGKVALELDTKVNPMDKKITDWIEQ